MADSWYYVKGGARQGPVTGEQLKGLLASGQLSVTDTVWREGMAGWTAAGQVPEFAGMTVPSTPPIPPTTPLIPAPPVVPVAPAVPAAAVKRGFAPGLRVMMIIGAVLAIGAFFAPYFYTTVTATMPEAMLKHPGFVAAVEQGKVMEGINKVEDFQEMLNKPFGLLVFGWKLWFAMVAMGAAGAALIFAIVDLSMPRAKVMRVVNQWVLFVLFVAIFAVSATGLTLGLCKIGLYAASPKEGNEIRSFDDIYKSNDATKKAAADMRKEFQKLLANVPAEQRAEQEKLLIEQNGDPAWLDQTSAKLSVIPIASPAAVVGGALGLIGVLIVIIKKK